MLEKIRDFFALKGNVAVLALTSIIWLSGEGLWFPFLPKYLEAIGATPVLIGLVFSVAMAGNSFFHFVGGYLSDVYGRKKLFVTALAVGVPSLLIIMLAPEWIFVIPGIVLMSFSESVAQTADSVMVTESLEKNRRATGRATIHILTIAAVTITSPIGGIIIQNMGILDGTRLSFVFNIITAAASAIIAAFFLRETLKKRKIKHNISHLNPMEVIRKLPTQVKYLILSRVFSLFAWGLIIPLFALYYLNIVGVSPVEFGFLVALHLVFFAVFTFVGAKISDKYGRKYTIIGLFMGASLMPLLLIFSTTFIQLAFVSVVWGMIGFGLSSIDAYTADHTPKKLRGKSIGTANTLFVASMIPGPVIGGFLFSLLPAAPFLISGLIGAVAVFMGWKLLK